MKLVSTGEGGAYLSKNKEFIEKLKIYNYLGLPINEKSGLDKSEDSEIGGPMMFACLEEDQCFVTFMLQLEYLKLKKSKIILKKKNIRSFYEKFLGQIRNRIY